MKQVTVTELKNNKNSIIADRNLDSLNKQLNKKAFKQVRLRKTTYDTLVSLKLTESESLDSVVTRAIQVSRPYMLERQARYYREMMAFENNNANFDGDDEE